MRHRPSEQAPDPRAARRTIFILTYPFPGGTIIAVVASGFFLGLPFAAGGALVGYLAKGGNDGR